MKKVLLLFTISLLCCNNAGKKKIPLKDYTSKNTEALAFCKANNFNDEFYYLVDLGIHSGRNRFFVYNFRTNAITHQNLATHGSCDQFEANPDKWEKAKFSNRNNSHCSSKGKYKIEKRDYSSWGINVKYWMHGLEPTNSNAVERIVVLHSWSAVANEEIFPRFSPLSWGCPAVSDDFMKILDTQLQRSEKPVLLWIIE